MKCKFSKVKSHANSSLEVIIREHISCYNSNGLVSLYIIENERGIDVDVNHIGLN